MSVRVCMCVCVCEGEMNELRAVVGARRAEAQTNDHLAEICRV